MTTTTTEELPLVITKHGDQRARARLGINRKAVKRMAERAWREGVHVGGEVRLHGEHRFVFAILPREIRLVTVVPATLGDRAKLGDRRHASARPIGVAGAIRR